MADEILNRMLSNISNDYDKTEGSFIYDAIKPAAVELGLAYEKLDEVSKSTSLDTATGDKLTEMCYQNGTIRKEATKAIRKGEFDIEIPLGSRFSTDGNSTAIFKAIEKIDDFNYKMECEQAGPIGNFYTGPLNALDWIENLESAELTDVITPGAEKETDEQLRERRKQNIINPPQDGNASQYKEWADKFGNIGAAKVFPLWDGGNTVKVAITNRLFQVAEPELVDAFQEYIDPNSEGLGNGVAPIGAKVTITGGTSKDINIVANVVLAEGYSEPEGVAEAVSAYLASVTYVKNNVSYMRTAVAILDTPSIVDLNSFTLNGGTDDVPLTGEEIPIVNSINLTVVS